LEIMYVHPWRVLLEYIHRTGASMGRVLYVGTSDATFWIQSQIRVAIGRWILSNLMLEDPANRDGSSFYSAWKAMFALDVTLRLSTVPRYCQMLGRLLLLDVHYGHHDQRGFGLDDKSRFCTVVHFSILRRPFGNVVTSTTCVDSQKWNCSPRRN
jgi:hypothetical protein